MQIVTFNFFIFLLISIVVYYIFPKNKRWIVLLISSILFFLFASHYKMILYLLFGIITTYFGTIYISKKIDNEKNKKIALIITLGSILLELCVLKYINLFPLTANAFGELFNLNISFKTISLLAPLGISYYTLSLIGYVTDVYRGTCKPQKNFLKHALFSCYYPVMISGPIIRYSEVDNELLNGNKFNWENIYLGFYRIVFGLMKKLVIANQLAIIVKTIFSDYQVYSGYFIVIGVIFYAIQIYADFSGCMDIVIGASKMYGVTLPENFNSPFFSRNLAEFWRRWHISLGRWAKDYIMYPLLKSALFQKLLIVCKEKFGKNIGKKIPIILAIFILWILIGIWHGASYRYIFAAGILPWIYLTVSQLFENLPKKINEKFHINTECFSFHLFQSLRTLALMCFIWLFVCSPSFLESFAIIKSIFILPSMNSEINIPLRILAIPCAIAIAAEYLNYIGYNVFELFKKQNLWFRWCALLLILFTTIIFGIYGPGYNASDFIYGGF